MNNNQHVYKHRSVWGSLEYYDKRYDRITTKSEKKLIMVNRLIHKITTTKDPVIRQVSFYDLLEVFFCI